MPVKQKNIFPVAITQQSKKAEWGPSGIMTSSTKLALQFHLHLSRSQSQFRKNVRGLLEHGWCVGSSLRWALYFTPSGSAEAIPIVPDQWTEGCGAMARLVLKKCVVS